MKTLNYFKAAMLAATGAVGFIVAGCANVKIATPEPVAIDVKMRVDVHSYGEDGEDKVKETNKKLSPQEGRKLRMGEVQKLKNDYALSVGEGKDGLLHMLHPPQNDEKYRDYAKEIIMAENADREAEFKARAESLSKPLEVITAEFVRHSYERAFPGEWVQEENGTWRQKK